MEWIKIKTSHVLIEYSDFTDTQIGAWVVAMCLTAALEKMPNEQQLKKHIHGSTLNSLKSGLSSHGVTLEYVLSKVLDDVEYTKSLKETNRSKIAKWREKKKNVTSNETVTEPDKIREDKIREDKTIYKGFEDEVVEKWNSFSTQYPAIKSIRSVTPERRKHLKRRFTNKDFVKSFDDVLAKIPTSDFLMGKSKPDAWRVDFDFLIRNDENYQKILEGKYGEQKFKSELDRYAIVG